jgi:hypothetical protein
MLEKYRISVLGDVADIVITYLGPLMFPERLVVTIDIFPELNPCEYAITDSIVTPTVFIKARVSLAP